MGGLGWLSFIPPTLPLLLFVARYFVVFVVFVDGT